MQAPSTIDIERFLALIERRGADQCWWWMGPIHQRYGLPLFSLPRAGRTGNIWVQATRFGWEHVFEKGALGPSEIIVRREHDWDRACPGPPSCPHLLCLNPEHMRVTTRAAWMSTVGARTRERT